MCVGFDAGVVSYCVYEGVLVLHVPGMQKRVKAKMYANCMQQAKKKKGFNCLKPFSVLGGPTWARTRDPLIMSQML